MALVQLPRLETHRTEYDEGTSDLEGASPTSTEYEPLEFYSPDGRQQCRMQPSGPHRRVLRWLVRKLNQHGKQQQGQHQPRAAEQLPSGSSYDSLSGLSDYSECRYDGPMPRPPVQHQHRLASAAPQEAGVSSNQLGFVETIAEQSKQEQQQAEGGLRRLVKAVLRPVVRFVHHMCSSSGPQGPGSNDNSLGEQIINVVTSIPFFVVGMHGFRQRRCPKARHFSLAFMAVGIVASVYHSASPCNPIRPFLRKMDYWTICYTSIVLRRAAHIPLPRPVAVAALLVAPVKPTAVTGLNLLLVESKYLRHALTHAHLRPSFKLHLGAGAIGMAAFAYEDIASVHWRWPPVLHSLWHCLSAVAMGCTSSLLSHLEIPLLLEGVQVENSS